MPVLFGKLLGDELVRLSNMKVVSLFSGAGGSSGIAHIQFQGIVPKVLIVVLSSCYASYRVMFFSRHFKLT